MAAPFNPNAAGEARRRMLEALGVKSVEELFSDIPEGARFKGDWDSLPIGAGRPLSEAEADRWVRERLSRNKVFLDPPPFLGAGVYPHYVPEAVRFIIERSEFLTSYTPYQPEASQGMLQALFEYQSLMAELLEFEVVNSSMYDWASAAAEAFLLALRYHRMRRRRILVPETMNPMHRRVVDAYLYPHRRAGVRVEEVPVDRETGYLDLSALDSMLGDDVAAVYLEYPSFLGVVDVNARRVGEAAHEHGALFVMGVNPLALGVLEPPGRLGADVAVGDGQPLGLGLNYGGPYLGVMAVRWDARLVRQMPGRLVGLTEDAEGRRAFTMILQAREQHIRRARATSNICTNEALAAVAVAAYLSLLGPEGLRELGEHVMYKARYAARKLSGIPGVEAPAVKGFYFNEYPVRFPVPYERVHRHLLRRGIHGGLPLEDKIPWLGHSALYAFTELHSKEHIDRLAAEVEEAVKSAGGA
ncbi:aminomethyl-transferring glycine dehydrogenase subunit GcvPA [Stetteria hydrogenophila]